MLLRASDELATHRHGRCVLQRCVDHASEMQRAQLMGEITYNALTLVQDPYVSFRCYRDLLRSSLEQIVQYILDLVTLSSASSHGTSAICPFGNSVLMSSKR
jgi:Pumilio-family RNA binding repeat